MGAFIIIWRSVSFVWPILIHWDDYLVLWNLDWGSFTEWKRDVLFSIFSDFSLNVVEDSPFPCSRCLCVFVGYTCGCPVYFIFASRFAILLPLFPWCVSRKSVTYFPFSHFRCFSILHIPCQVFQLLVFC